MLQTPDQLFRSRDTSVLLRSGLNLIKQALSIYSDDLKLIVGNTPFKLMFNLPDQLSEPGADFASTIRYLAKTGEYGQLEDVEAFVQARVDQARTFEAHYLERQRANGRWVSVEGGPLRQGGWVTVYTDITETKRQEELMRSESSELSGKLLDRSEELARTNRALESTITQLHETQQHLEAAEARIRLAAETTPAHIARFDLEERYTYSNQRLPVDIQNNVTNIVGHSARHVLGEDVYQHIAPAMQAAFAGESKVVEFENPTDGRHIRVTFTPDTNAAGEVTGAYVLSVDTTQTATVPKVQEIASFGPWTAHLSAMELRQKDERVLLSKAETALLRLFLSNPNRVLSRNDIFTANSIENCSDRALDVRISRLRSKLRDDPKTPKLLRTIYGAGYVFTAEVGRGD